MLYNKYILNLYIELLYRYVYACLCMYLWLYIYIYIMPMKQFCTE